MEQIKKHLTDWNTRRVIRLVFTIALSAAYISTKEGIYLLGAVIFALQVVFNMSCPGGSCNTTATNTKEPAIKTKKYEPGK